MNHQGTVDDCVAHLLRPLIDDELSVVFYDLITIRSEGQSVQHITDRAADLRLEKSGTVSLVSARRWKAATHGVEPLKELNDAVVRLKAQYGVYVVLQGTVSETARAFAKEHGLLLLEGDALAAMLLKSKSGKA